MLTLALQPTRASATATAPSAARTVVILLISRSPLRNVRRPARTPRSLPAQTTGHIGRITYRGTRELTTLAVSMASRTASRPLPLAGRHGDLGAGTPRGRVRGRPGYRGLRPHRKAH